MHSVSSGHIQYEARVHGREWAGLHGGYFSDRRTSAGYLDAIARALRGAGATTIVDLSSAQLAAVQDPAIRNVCRSVGEVRREEVCARDQRVLFIMRSVAASSRRISAARLESVAPGVYYVLEHM